MKYTTFTLLAAALASVCTAAPTTVAPAVVTTPVPAKFTLTYVPLGHAPDGQKLPGGYIIGSNGYGTMLLVAPYNILGGLEILEFTGRGTSVYMHDNEFSDNVNFFMDMSSHSTIWMSFSDDVTKLGSGLALVNGSLTWDSGSGPKALWSVCRDGESWGLHWDESWDSCVKVTLKVNAL